MSKKIESSTSWVDPSGPAIQPVHAIPTLKDSVQEIAYRAAVIKELKIFGKKLGELEKKVCEQETPFKMKGYPILFHPKIPNLLIQDYQSVKLQLNNSYYKHGNYITRASEQILRPKGMNWTFPTSEEGIDLCVHCKDIFKQAKGITLKGGEKYILRDLKVERYDVTVNGDILDLKVCPIPQNLPVVVYLAGKDLYPKFLTKEEEALAHEAWLLSEERYINLHKDDAGRIKFQMFDSLVDACRECVSSGDDYPSFAPEAGLPLRELELSTEDMLDIKTEFLNRDFIRANITPEDIRRLEDPNGGSWDLWEELLLADCAETPVVRTQETLYARNPQMDIQHGVIGIDFGTKSTVVACLNGSDRIYPMRVGTGQLEKQISSGDYENPTVIEFLDIEHFLDEYKKKDGRPLTRWEDITVSYTASDHRKENDDTNLYASFFGELKQWAGDPRRNVRIRDKKTAEGDGHWDETLPPYLELTEEDIDPIEYYAYYIGLYINNARTKEIYLNYLLSFPVTYTQEVRRRILDSFRRGLKKSLPESILKDPSCMEKFSVSQGAGEPAAYAVCALQEYGLLPQGEERIFYGVFDFGGGTTDFDFGIWRKASGAKERRYSYVIEHFGDSGDQYLGGENLLGILAYNAFWDNEQLLRENGISFTRPPECEPRPGGEVLVSNSQEAHTNMRLMQEALRDLWERRDGYEEIFANGVLKMTLHSEDGSDVSVEMAVDQQKLEDILKKRIESGVDEFFKAMLAVFRREETFKKIEGIARCNISIFLAGNSCKSEILQDIFRQKIQAYEASFQEELVTCGNTSDEFSEDKLFELYYPLGTPQAIEKQRLLGVLLQTENAAGRPTGKTGVAFGLVQCRKGGKIKVIDEKKVDEEIKFKYWLGDDEDGFFASVLSRDTPYQTWVEYYDAGVENFEFYYTKSSSAEYEKRLSLSDERVKWSGSLTIPQVAVNENWLICLRSISPDTIEYTVAESAEAANAGELKCKTFQVRLES